jgi:hypothetical protein
LGYDENINQLYISSSLINQTTNSNRITWLRR